VLGVQAWQFNHLRVITHAIFFYVIQEDRVRSELRILRELIYFDVLRRDMRQLKTLLGMKKRSGEQLIGKNNEVRDRSKEGSSLEDIGEKEEGNVGEIGELVHAV
jgi:hypothetical protein